MDKKKPKVTETKINLDNPPCGVDGVRLNAGSGSDKKKGYLNFDKYNSKADANWDIFDIPMNDDSVAQVFAYEVVEHLPTTKVLDAFKEIHRVLKPGGNIVLVVPDLIDTIENFIKKPNDEFSLARIYGSQTHEGQYHKTGFTDKRLFTLLALAGFKKISMAYFDTFGKNIYCEAVK